MNSLPLVVLAFVSTFALVYMAGQWWIIRAKA